MSSLYRDKNNLAKPTAAHDFSPELGIGYPASGWWAILKLFPTSPLPGSLPGSILINAFGYEIEN
jgi:hypothetical protein